MQGGNDRVTWRDSLEEDLRGLLDRFAPGLRDLLETEARRIGDEARGRWPVSTGASRAGLVAGVEVRAGQWLRGFLRNDVDHAVYVKSWKNGLQGKSAMVELLRRPMDAVTPRVVARVSELFQLVARGA